MACSMKRVFITGASAGIGLATAKLLADRGDEVWGTSRDVARIPQLPRLHAVRLDLGDTVSLGESFNAALREAGHFDVVINNAGSGHFGPARIPFGGGRAGPVSNGRLRAHRALPARPGLDAGTRRRTHHQRHLAGFAAARSIHGGLQRGESAMASFTMSLQLELEGIKHPRH